MNVDDWLIDDASDRSRRGNPGNSPGTPSTNQWTVSSIFWITTAAALVLAYAASLGRGAMWQAVLYTGFVIVFGALIGCVRRDWTNAFFWGGLYALLAYLAVAGGNVPSPAIGIGWGVVGATVGSLVGIRVPSGSFAGTIVAACVGWLSMVGVVLVMRESISGQVAFDTYIAGAVGALLKPFTMILQWFENESRQPRFVLASWLATSVLVGNWLVPLLAGITR